MGRNKELDGEQMRAPGEGEIATAVDEKPGATGGEHDMASDLDRYVESENGAFGRELMSMDDVEKRPSKLLRVKPKRRRGRRMWM